MYKLIAIDLDGTLLTDEKNITEENIDFLNYLNARGYEIVIATGRGYYSAKRLARDLHGHITFISSNGNVVRNSEDDKDIFQQSLNNEDSKLVIREGKLFNLYPIIHVDHYHKGYDIVLSRESIRNNKLGNQVNADYRVKEVENYLDSEIDKVMAIVYPGKKDELRQFDLYIQEKYPNRFATHLMENIRMAEALYEVMNPRVSKWNSIIEYAETKGIKKEEIIAIGDDNNDLDMIKNAGLGIAMINGSSLVKEAADIISEKDNNQSGVALELRRILNLKSVSCK